MITDDVGDNIPDVLIERCKELIGQTEGEFHSRDPPVIRLVPTDPLQPNIGEMIQSLAGDVKQRFQRRGMMSAKFLLEGPRVFVGVGWPRFQPHHNSVPHKTRVWR